MIVSIWIEKDGKNAYSVCESIGLATAIVDKRATSADEKRKSDFMLNNELQKQKNER